MRQRAEVSDLRMEISDILHNQQKSYAETILGVQRPILEH
jgi:hypothetical protein